MKSFLLIIILISGAGCGEGQRRGARFDADAPRRMVDGRAECPDCEIVLEHVATLGQPEDPTSIREDAMFRACAIDRLSTGEYVVGGVVGGREVAVYGDVGRLLRAIGREGQGPGEFGRDLDLIVGSGDTVHVVDNSNYRVVSVTASGDFIGSFRIRSPLHSFALLRSGGLLIHGRPPASGDDQPLFRLLDRSGNRIAAFGEPSEELAELDQWMVSPGGAGGFWTASLWTYELYHWSEPDSLLETLVRDVEWFPATQDLSQERLADIYRKAPPPAVMWNVREDERGRLWTYTLVPDADWKPGPIDTPVPEWSREQLDTMLEIIDTAGPRLIARRRFDHVLGRLCGSELVYRVLDTASGDTRAEILRPKLLSP